VACIMDRVGVLLTCEAQTGMSIVDAEALLALTRHVHITERTVGDSAGLSNRSKNIIIVTVPHAACQVMGINEQLLNSASIATLAAIQHQLDTAYPAGPRMCDRRALVGAIALRVAFLRLYPFSAAAVGAAEMVVVVNQEQPRIECDANRESCHGPMRDKVADTVTAVEGRVVWNLDVHSFPPEHTRDDIYMLARVHPEPFASRKWSLLGESFGFHVYAGSEMNYFMKWFEDEKRVPSLLVEFCESAERYPLPILNHDAHLIVNFVLHNINLYKTLAPA